MCVDGGGGEYGAVSGMCGGVCIGGEGGREGGRGEELHAPHGFGRTEVGSCPQATGKLPRALCGEIRL